MFTVFSVHNAIPRLHVLRVNYNTFLYSLALCPTSFEVYIFRLHFFSEENRSMVIKICCIVCCIKIHFHGFAYPTLYFAVAGQVSGKAIGYNGALRHCFYPCRQVLVYFVGQQRIVCAGE